MSQRVYQMLNVQTKYLMSLKDMNFPTSLKPWNCHRRIGVFLNVESSIGQWFGSLSLLTICYICKCKIIHYRGKNLQSVRQNVFWVNVGINIKYIFKLINTVGIALFYIPTQHSELCARLKHSMGKLSSTGWIKNQNFLSFFFSLTFTDV